jgi:hypothetical protein
VTLAGLLLLTGSSRAQAPEQPPVAQLPVPAEPEPEGGKIQTSLILFLGPQKYKMSDINREIDLDNEDFEGSGFELEKLSGGFGYGVGIRVVRSRRLGLELDYQRLPASVKHSGLAGTVPVEEDISIPANGFLLSAEVFRDWHRFHYGIAAGPGFYTTKGHIDAAVGTARTSIPVRGHGFGFHVLGLVDIGISRTLHFDGGVGYRMAKTGNLKVYDNDLVLEDGSSVRADWSGLTMRLGFSVPFNPGTYPENPSR